MARRRKEDELGLDTYRAKRDFARTPEPPPGPERSGAEVCFVVHRHDATRLHYDLRLEMDGVLRSWAVPKGFSYDPKEKHLALRTEDHPIEYYDFHGVIPEGQYGAGTMTIWDRGTYEVVKAPDGPTAVKDGELKVILRGRRLRGEWHLVRTSRQDDPGKQQWLLFKSRDAYSGPARDSATGLDLATAEQRALPRSVRPMLTGDRRKPFADPDWWFEMRFAGRRVQLEKRGENVRVRGLKRTPPEIEDGLRRLRAETALVDGVLVALDEHERPSAELVEERLAGRSDAPLFAYAFDLLYYEEFDLRALPLADRKTALRAVVPEGTALLYVDHVAGDGEALAEVVARAGLDGLVAKRATSPYRSGASADWLDVPVDAAAGSGPVSATLAHDATDGPRLRVKLTNLEKVFWPSEGYTKGDLVAWYGRVADLLLPYLAGRPVHMDRRPDGIEGKSFYQRQAKEDLPDWVRTVEISSESKGETALQMVCDDRDTLLWLANQGSVDLHPWLSRVGSLDEPDWAVLDLDAKESPFEHVIEVARCARRLLDQIGLRGYLKTSGKSGMHVYVPLVPGYTYDHACLFCEGLARVICRELSAIATVERIPGKRGGRLYVDFLQNRRSQTVVPPYVPRPVRGAQVSTPLAWDELTDDLHPSKFTIRTLPARLDEVGDLFRGALDDRQELLPAIEALEALLKKG